MTAVNGKRPKRVILAAVHLPPAPMGDTEQSLDELEALAGTLLMAVTGRTIQVRNVPDRRTYIGRGKLDELRGQLQHEGADMVLFDNNLSPRQGQLLEEHLGCMVWDRTQTILEIFARHARTAEARAQVELATLKYMLPRLVGMWAHLDRERGGIGASRGMGEKQINIDRQIIRKRIGRLERSLKKIAVEEKTRRKLRSRCLQVGLVGYTNAGKSTLMNLLTGSGVQAEDRLFATLDSTTRALKGVSKPEILISDTVGFIRNLPHGLVASFRSTLNAVLEADLLLHVADAGHPALVQQIETTAAVLREIGAEDIPLLLVLNKADLVPDETGLLILSRKYAGSLPVSALDPDARGPVIQKIQESFREHFFHHTVKLPYSKSGRLADLYAHAIVDGVDYKDDAMYVDCTISRANKNRLDGLL